MIKSIKLIQRYPHIIESCAPVFYNDDNDDKLL